MRKNTLAVEVENAYPPLKMTAQFLRANLSLELYPDYSSMLWEIVRNAACACMPDRKVWTPGVGDVEIFLAEHPVAKGAESLIVLDHGRGLTPIDKRRYCGYIGATMEDLAENPSGHNNGAGQKRQGRLAAIGCNANAEDDLNEGYYVFSRTSGGEQITFIAVIPALFEKNQGFAPLLLDKDDPMSQFFANVRGSFTAIVIPHTVFSSYEEIRNALRWRMPRKPEQAFKLVIGGKKLEPPPLFHDGSFYSPRVELAG